MDSLLDKLYKIGENVSKIEDKALKEGAEILKDEISENMPRSNINKKHIADNIKISGVKFELGEKYVLVGPQRGENGEFFYGKFNSIILQHTAIRKHRLIICWP